MLNTPIWLPYLQKDINNIKSVHRRYNEKVCNSSNICNTFYHERLGKLKRLSLEYRRYHFDLTTLLKIINGISELYFVQFYNNFIKDYLLWGNNKKYAQGLY